jgi:hypothetical protein
MEYAEVKYYNHLGENAFKLTSRRAVVLVYGNVSNFRMRFQFSKCERYCIRIVLSLRRTGTSAYLGKLRLQYLGSDLHTNTKRRSLSRIKEVYVIRGNPLITKHSGINLYMYTQFII